MESGSSSSSHNSLVQEYQQLIRQEKEALHHGIPLPLMEAFKEERSTLEKKAELALIKSMEEYLRIKESKSSYVSSYATKDNYYGDWLPVVKENEKEAKEACAALQKVIGKGSKRF
nr:ORFY protein [Cacao swollen shoot Ghana Q virus]